MIDSTETPMRRPVLVQTVNMWQSRWRRLPVWFRRHGIALTIVLLASVIAQAVTLAQTPHIVVDHDGPSYLKAAHAILTQHQFLDATRTPGYPILLALIFGVTGEQNLTAVTYVQAALVVIATLEVYPLVYLIARRGWVACILATLVGTNLYILDWERLVRYETLSYFLLITLFLVLALYARTERMRFLGALTALFVMAILTRPALVLLPGILLVLLTFRSQRMALLRIQWRRLLLSLVVTYGLIGGYMTANEVAFGFFGLGTDTNITLFGKVLEYRMQNETNSAQYAQVRADADQYVQTVSLPGSTGPLSPYTFVYGAWRNPPDYKYSQNSFALLGAYSRDIILHHPIQYILDSIPDILAGWNATPTDFYAPYSATSKWIYRLFLLSHIELLTYLLLPVALVLLTVMVWRAPREDGAFILWALMMTATATLIVDAVAKYAEFYRLREPFDWTMIVTVGILVIDALALAYEKVQPALLAAFREHVNALCTRRQVRRTDWTMLDHVGAEAASLWKRLRTGADRATVIGFAIPLVAVAAATHAILVEGRAIVTSPPCRACDSTRYMSMAMYPFANTYHSRNPPFMWRIALPTLAHVLAGSAQTDAVQEWFWRITVCAVAVTAVLLQVFFRKLGMSQPSAVAASTLYVLFGFGGMELLHGFITPDAVAEACIAGVLVCALYRRGRLLFAILLLGAFVKESIVLGAVFAILWALQRRDWRLLKWAGAGAIGMVVVFLALRIALTPFRWQSPYSLQGEFQHVLYIMTPALAWERLVRSTVGTWGLVLPLAVLQLSHAPRIWRNWAFPAFLLVTYGQLLITRTDIERLIVFAFPVVVAAAAFEFEYLAKRLRVSPLWLWVPVFLTVPITWTWPDWVRVMFFWWASALGHLNVGIYTRMLYQPVNYVAGVLALAALGGSAAAWVAERLIVRRSIMEQGQAPREQQIENTLL